MNTKQIITFITVAWCSATVADAQTYLDHLKQTNTSKGSVVVTQSKEIDALVNGVVVSAQVVKTPAKEVQDKGKNNVGPTPNVAPTPKQVSPQNVVHDSAAKAENARREAEAARREADMRRMAENKGHEAVKNEKEDNEMEIATVDMRKKVMRGSHKVTGYRVQVFAGGNTRSDKQKAQEIGNVVKMKFPDQPIYVHFYSPRWICRAGNFRSYQEAERMLKQVRAMGYRSATIVRGQISVQY